MSDFAVSVRYALGMFGLSDALYAFVRHNENAVYRVSAGDGDYLLRLHVSAPGRAFEHRASWLEGEMAFIDIMRSGGIRTQRPIRSKTGSYIVDTPCGVPATMLSWLPGGVLDQHADYAQRMARVAGEMAARMHDISLHHPYARDIDRPRYDGKRMRNAIAAMGGGVETGLFSAAMYRVLREGAECVGAAMDAAMTASGAHSLIHADMGLGNLIVSEDGKTLSPIDFGLCGHAPLMFDVGGLMGAFDIPALRRAAVEGYNAVRPLSDADYRGVEAGFLAGIYLFMAAHIANEHVAEWFTRRLPVVTEEYILPFIKHERFLNGLLGQPL